MKVWIARNEGDLCCHLFQHKPDKVFDKYAQRHCWLSHYPDGNIILFDGMLLNASFFSEVTFENSPQEVELVLKKQ